ncbi:Ig-like domain-containing protein [Listeria kieliensis]|uniref:Modifier protein of major autolysin LytC n=1 Tax=Listeria kieliensis TaxID=1621700 RepID=A0A3D8TKS1_9LIST|nr:Ig-like domain-containing protein [Listeria kieliensis]RDW99449.1 modifier protein of major autolysin LytC [Listeria kieliensis]
MEKKKILKKGAVALIVFNVLISTAAASFTAVAAGTNSKVNIETRSTVVTPENLLKNPGFTSNTLGFDDWVPAYNDKVITGQMSKDNAGYFIFKKDDVTVGSISGGLRFSTAGGKGTLTQKIHVFKGETYRLNATVRDIGGLFDAGADFYYKVGTKETRVAAKNVGNLNYNYTATETGDIDVTVGVLRGNNFSGSAYMTLTNLAFKNTDITPPAAPTINPIYTDANLATGKAEPNTTVILTTEDGELVKGAVNANGDYSVQLPRQIMGRIVTVVNQDIAGNISDSTTSLPIRQGELSLPAVNEVTNDSTTVSGEADLAVNVNVKVIKKDGTEKAYLGSTDTKGHFSIEITKPEYGDIVQVVTSGNGKVSPTSETKVSDVIKPVAPIIEEVYTDTTELKGQGTVGNKVQVTLPTGVLDPVSVAADGSFKVTIPTQEEGAKIGVAQIKPSGLKGDATVIVVKPGNLPQPIINEVTDQSTRIEGSATPNANFKIVLKNKEGLEVSDPYVGTVDSTGKFSILLVDKLSSEYTVTMTLTKGDQISKPKTIKVKDVTAPDAPVVNNISADDKIITGTGEAGTKAIAKVNGQEIGYAIVEADGQFKISIQPQSENAVVTVILEDAAKNTSTAVSKTVTRSTKFDLIVPDTLNIGTSSFSGTFGVGISKVRLFVNGAVVSQATTKNGEYTFTNVDKFVVSTTDKVEVVGVDSKYAIVNRIQINVKGNLTKVLIPDAYGYGSSKLTGKYEDSAYKIRLFVNGKVQAQAIMDDKTHTFTFNNAANLITSPTDKVEVTAVNKQYAEIYRANVTVENSAANTLTVQPYEMGSTTLTGTYGKGISKIRLVVDGKIVSQAINDNGTYTFKNVDKLITSNQAKVEVVAVNSIYQEIGRKDVQLSGVLYTLTANAYNAGDQVLSGTYGKGISKVRLFVNGKVKAQASMDEATHTFKFNNVSSFITNPKDKIELVAVNSQYVEVKRLIINVVNPDELNGLSVDGSNYKLGADTLSGTYGTLGFKVRLFVNGKVKSQAENAEGKFVFNGLKSLEISVGDALEIVLVNSHYQEINRISVSIVE